MWDLAVGLGYGTWLWDLAVGLGCGTWPSKCLQSSNLTPKGFHFSNQFSDWMATNPADWKRVYLPSFYFSKKKVMDGDWCLAGDLKKCFLHKSAGRRHLIEWHGNLFHLTTRWWLWRGQKKIVKKYIRFDFWDGRKIIRNVACRNVVSALSVRKMAPCGHRLGHRRGECRRMFSPLLRTGGISTNWFQLLK